MSSITGVSGFDLPIQGDPDDVGNNRSTDGTTPKSGHNSLETNDIDKFLPSSLESVRENMEYDAHGQNPESAEVIYQPGGTELSGIIRDKLIRSRPESASVATDDKPQGSADILLDSSASENLTFNRRGNAQVQWVEGFPFTHEEGSNPEEYSSPEFQRSEMNYDAAGWVVGYEEAGSQPQEVYEHVRENVDFDGQGQNPETEQAIFQQGRDALSRIIRDRLNHGLPGSAPGGGEVSPQENAVKNPDDSPGENLDFNSRGNTQILREEQFLGLEGSGSDDDDD